MKKLAITLSIAFCAVFSVQAQGNFSAGISGGIPVGDAGDFYDFSVIIDAAYIFEVSDAFEAGPVTGYSLSFGKDQDLPLGGTISIEEAQFIPIAGRAQWNFADAWSLAGDIGYAIGVNSGNDGGFYYSPRLAFAATESLDIVAAYRGVSSDFNFDIISLGVDFTFGGSASEE